MLKMQNKKKDFIEESKDTDDESESKEKFTTIKRKEASDPKIVEEKSNVIESENERKESNITNNTSSV